MRKVLVIAMVLAFAGSAFGSWSDDFDSYVTGSSLTSPSQGGWEGWDGSAANAIASNDQALSGPNSAKLFQWDDLVRQYSGITSGSWVYTAWQYIPSTHQGVVDYEDLSGLHLSSAGLIKTLAELFATASPATVPVGTDPLPDLGQNGEVQTASAAVASFHGPVFDPPEIFELALGAKNLVLPFTQRGQAAQT